MNARAGKLVAALRSIARTLPASSAISFYFSIEHDLLQIDAVSDRAGELMAALRGLACTLPGITGIGLHGLATCDLVQLTAATDADVHVLGRALDLDAHEIRIGEGEGRGRWWLHAALREGQDDTWIDLAGPHHEGPPPGDDHAASASPAVYPLHRASPEFQPPPVLLAARNAGAGRRLQRPGRWHSAPGWVALADGGGTMPVRQVDDEAQRADGRPPRGMGDRR